MTRLITKGSDGILPIVRNDKITAVRNARPPTTYIYKIQKKTDGRYMINEFKVTNYGLKFDTVYQAYDDIQEACNVAIYDERCELFQFDTEEEEVIWIQELVDKEIEKMKKLEEEKLLQNRLFDRQTTNVSSYFYVGSTSVSTTWWPM